MKVVSKKLGYFLIFVTCFSYAVAYLGRLSFSANLTAIKTEFMFTKDSLGLVGSFLFFSYGFGQVVNSFLAKKYNPKYVFAIAMAISCICNITFTFANSIPLMCTIWLINGLSQSMLWCNVLNVQARFISQKQIGKCIVFGGFSYCLGTCLIYLLSSIFVSINWRITFYIVSLILAFTSIFWFISIDKMEKAEKEDEVVEGVISTGKDKVKLFNPMFTLIFVFASLVAVFNSFIRDGLITWLPTLVKEEFGLSESYSTLIVVVVSLFSVFGITFANLLAKKIKGNLFLECVLYCIITVLCVVSFIIYKGNILIPFVCVISIQICLVYGVSNVITSKIPFGIRQFGNVGSISALLDAFCYLGSMLSTYIFGFLAENFGWNIVLITIMGMSFVAIIMTFIGGVLAKKDEKTKLVF